MALKNAQIYPDCDVHIAAYNRIYDDEGNYQGDKFCEVVSGETLQAENRFQFSDIYDMYKVMIWENGTMKPVIKAYTVEN